MVCLTTTPNLFYVMHSDGQIEPKQILLNIVQPHLAKAVQ